jgi:hypothetical protein
MRFLLPKWCDLCWTEWVSFSERFTHLPSSPGIYRVRITGADKIAYLGQTGRSLRERLGGLRHNTLQDIMPFNDPHTAAPSLWAWRDAASVDYECSCAEVHRAKAERHALECHLLWQYRCEAGESTLCNHGRFHARYVKSRNRHSGFGGRRLSPDEPDNPGAGFSREPYSFKGRLSTRIGWV